jgi:hypothetical protein
MKLKPFAFGISIGIVSGGSLFLITLLSYFTGYGKLFLETVALSLYPGYSISPPGAILGLFYGFIDLFAVGAVFCWLYNKISGHH